MNVTLVHNPTAGDGRLRADDLRDALKAGGHEVRYASTKEDDWQSALQQPGDLVLVAGGDGTVAKVVRQLDLRPVPLVIVPSGTANNFGRTLGLPADWRTLVRRLEELRPRAFDAGLAIADWGKRLMLEGASFGPVADAIALARALPTETSNAQTDPRRMGWKRLLRIVRESPARCALVQVDDSDLSGDVVLVAVLNAGLIGTQLRLSAEASPRSGRLHVVVVRGTDRRSLEGYLEERLAGRDPEPTFEEHAGAAARIDWPGSRMHIDDEVFEAPTGRIDVAFNCVPGALRIMLPD